MIGIVVDVQQCTIERIFRRHDGCVRNDNATLGKNRMRTALPTFILCCDGWPASEPYSLPVAGDVTVWLTAIAVK